MFVWWIKTKNRNKILLYELSKKRYTCYKEHFWPRCQCQWRFLSRSQNIHFIGWESFVTISHVKTRNFMRIWFISKTIFHWTERAKTHFISGAELVQINFEIPWFSLPVSFSFEQDETEINTECMLLLLRCSLSCLFACFVACFLTFLLALLFVAD